MATTIVTRAVEAGLRSLQYALSSEPTSVVAWLALEPWSSCLAEIKAHHHPRATEREVIHVIWTYWLHGIASSDTKQRLDVDRRHPVIPCSLLIALSIELGLMTSLLSEACYSILSQSSAIDLLIVPLLDTLAANSSTFQPCAAGFIKLYLSVLSHTQAQYEALRHRLPLMLELLADVKDDLQIIRLVRLVVEVAVPGNVAWTEAPVGLKLKSGWTRTDRLETSISALASCRHPASVMTLLNAEVQALDVPPSMEMHSRSPELLRCLECIVRLSLLGSWRATALPLQGQWHPLAAAYIRLLSWSEKASFLLPEIQVFRCSFEAIFGLCVSMPLFTVQKRSS